MHYIGLDVHQKIMAYCLKSVEGTVLRSGAFAATRTALETWRLSLPQPWTIALEATIFTGWVYDELAPHGPVLVAHPARLKAIASAKHKNDAIDAATLCDLLRVNLLPTCHMADTRTRDLRRVLRYRQLLVRQRVQMHNRMAGLLMETGTEFAKKRLAGKRYFRQLLSELEHVPDSVIELMKLSRSTVEALAGMERQLLKGLLADEVLAKRVAHLMTIPGVGALTALTWALEMGDIHRFASVKDAVSYCGLCGDERSSAGKLQRTPISKQRNQHVQVVLIQAAKLGPRNSPELALLYDRERQKSNANRATLAVARKLVAWLLAVDRGRRDWRKQHEQPQQPAA